MLRCVMSRCYRRIYDSYSSRFVVRKELLNYDNSEIKYNGLRIRREILESMLLQLSTRQLGPPTLAHHLLCLHPHLRAAVHVRPVHLSPRNSARAAHVRVQPHHAGQMPPRTTRNSCFGIQNLGGPARKWFTEVAEAGVGLWCVVSSDGGSNSLTPRIIVAHSSRPS